MSRVIIFSSITIFHLAISELNLVHLAKKNVSLKKSSKLDLKITKHDIIAGSVLQMKKV